jgi:serine beta-lactamase-like protein LACTB, mitochondrial
MTPPAAAIKPDVGGRAPYARGTQEPAAGRPWRPCAVALLAVVLGALALGIGCAGGAGSEEVRETDYAGCRTLKRGEAFADEIRAARPLVMRMKRSFGAPGLAVAVAVHGRVVWSEACGYADLKKRMPVGRTTAFRVGSVSKMFTAVAAARLAEQRRLDLDAPIQRYVPSFPTKRHPVTIRRLLAHTAGIRHYEGNEALSRTHYDSVTEALRVFAADPLLFKPGTQHSYSSYGFNLVGAAIEAITRARYGNAVGRLVLTPLGMKRTALDDGQQRNGWAALYEVTASRRAQSAPSIDLSNRLPSGGFRSSADDLALFGSRLGDEGFVRRQTQRMLFREQRLADGRGTGYGLGFEVGGTPFGQVVGHTGNVVGGTAFLLASPRARVALALATNIGYVTAASPPDLRAVPDPPALFIPFVKRSSSMS